MEADMAAVREENANLWEIIRTKHGDDVEKGKVRVEKRSVPASKVVEKKALCAAVYHQSQSHSAIFNLLLLQFLSQLLFHPCPIPLSYLRNIR